MYKSNVFFIMSFLFLIVFVCGCVSQKMGCKELSSNFDAKINSINPEECDKWDFGKNPIWVGGTLKNMSTTYDSWHNHGVHSLTFVGIKKEGIMRINTNISEIPYQIGKYYKFDLGKECVLFYSMASSGSFYDPNLTALEHMECTN
jgi:hypothetical protein